MKPFTCLVLGTALLATAGIARAEEIPPRSAGSPSATGTTTTAPAEPGDAMTRWLLLAEFASADGGKLTALHGCPEPDEVAGIVSGLARQLQTAATPTETSRPWQSCGEDGCP